MTHTINTSGPLRESPARPPSREEQRESLVRLVVIVLAGIGIALATGTFSTVAVVIALLVMIMLHELGHFLTAKAAGMKVTEFFVGFGPRLWSVRKGETEYGVKAIPAGGYCRIIGMHNLEEVAPEDEPRAYRRKPYLRRLSVVLAGSAMHFLIAFILLFVGYTVVGQVIGYKQDLVVGSISRLVTGPSPAQRAGFEPGDRIISVDGRTFPSWDALPAYIRSRPDEQLIFVVERDGTQVTLRPRTVNRNPQGERVGFIGIGPALDVRKKGPVDGFTAAATGLGRDLKLATTALASFFSPGSLRDYTAQLSGGSQLREGRNDDNRLLSPIGAVRIASQAADTGLRQVLELLIAINVFVGVFNLIPLLPLDGGHVAIATYEAIRSRRNRRYTADVAKLLPLTYGVVFVLLALAASSLYLDVVRPIANPFQ